MQKPTTGNSNRLTWVLFTSLVTVTLAVAGAFGAATWQHESRLTRVETCVDRTEEDIREIKDAVKELTRYIRDRP